jgi:hypothetical protein
MKVLWISICGSGSSFLRLRFWSDFKVKKMSFCMKIYLKVVGNEKEGVKKEANDRNWPQTAAIEV